MQIVRTIGWIMLTAIVVAFVIVNWGDPQDVKFWPKTGGGWYVFPWPVGFIAMVFFVLGFAPMWLWHRASKWQAKRRIAALEAAARTAAVTPVAPRDVEVEEEQALHAVTDTPPASDGEQQQ